MGYCIITVVQHGLKGLISYERLFFKTKTNMNIIFNFIKYSPQSHPVDSECPTRGTLAGV